MLRDPDCQRCPLHKTADYVCLLPEDLRPNPIAVIGEAPGQREDKSGKAFVGRSGQLLRKALRERGLDKALITNAVACHPPDNRTPTKSEVRKCKFWLDKQLRRTKPKYALLLGNTALLSITGETGIKKKRGKPFDLDGVTYMATYHPSYVLREPSEEATFLKDLDTFQALTQGKRKKEEVVEFLHVKTKTDVHKFLRALRGDVGIDIETSCLYPWGDPIYKKDEITGYTQAVIVSISFTTRRGTFLLELNEWTNPGNKEGEYVPTWDRDELDDLLEKIGQRLEKAFVIAQNGKFDFLWLWVKYGVEWYKYFDFDTMLAHYALDENDFHGLDHLAKKYLGAEDWDVDLATKQGKNGFPAMAKYQAKDTFYLLPLKDYLERKLDEDGEVKRVFEHILMPASRLFTEIEHDGLYIDTERLEEAGQYLRGELAAAEKEMKKYGNLENWGSTKQLSEFLFTKKGLNLPIIERTKKGGISTSESVIKRIDHPVAGAILKFRGAKQQLSFFIEGWRPYIRRSRLHPSFKLHGTVTGRLSCQNPNLQQVPRDPRIRSLITAPEGWVLIEADLSQIELRIAAELAQEPTLLNAFATGKDPHWITALREIERGGAEKDLVIRTARALGTAKKVGYADAFPVLLAAGADMAVEIDKTWKELRKKAKAVNFGFLFGMWWKKFKIYARDNYGVNITDQQAQDAHKFFFDTYRFAQWHERQRRYARMNGYVRSLSGRKRRLPMAMSQVDSYERAEAERQAINSPVQGFASDINVMAALQLRREYGRDKVRIAGTVHDAILAYVKREHVVEVTNRLLEIMAQPELFKTFEIHMSVPIEADAKVGPWGSGVSLEKWS